VKAAGVADQGATLVKKVKGVIQFIIKVWSHKLFIFSIKYAAA